MSIATIEEFDAKLIQAVRQQVSRSLPGITLNFQWPSYFKNEPLFGGLMWVVIGVSEGMERFVHS